MIYFTSDLHFCHDKDFLYTPRGFDNIDDMNQAILENWNNLITDEDEVYVLGDLVLTDTDKGLEFIKQLKGHIHVIRGNHDTDTKVNRYIYECQNIESVDYALEIKYKKAYFYLSHYPTITANYDDDKPWAKNLINLYGHTHQETNFYNDCPYIYHVGLDSHNNIPVSIDKIIEDIKKRKEEMNNERQKSN